MKCGFGEQLHASELLKSQIMDSNNRPDLAFDYLTSDHRFLLHYDKTGLDAIDTTSTIIPGTPDWLVIADRALQHAWHLLVDSLGFMPPPMDSVSYPDDPPGGAHDIYFVNFGYYGMTYPEDLVTSTARPQDYTGYMSIENDFKGFPTTGIPALEVTLAHEFFHLIHLGYAYKTDSQGFNVQDLWWYELSSTWFENVAYPSVDDYLNYAPQYFNFPKPLDETSGYEVGQYGEVLSSYHKPPLMEKIWSDFIDNSAYTSIDRGLHTEAGYSFADSYQKFAGWNLITGTRSVAGQGFTDAGQLPEIATETRSALLDSARFSGQLASHEIRYFPLETKLQDDQLYSIGFSGDNSQVRGIISSNSDEGHLLDFGDTQTHHDLLSSSPGVVGLLAVSNGAGNTNSFQFIFQRKLFSIYPNPLVVTKHSSLHIFTSANIATPEIRLYDIRGREVFHKILNSQYSVSDSSLVTLSIPVKTSGLSKLPSGIYFLQMDSPDGKRVGKITLLK